jgi:hypothetical protein
LKKEWVIAYRFATMEAAKQGWEAVRNIILAEDLDASAYRSKINGQAHVVIIGDEPMTSPLQDRFGSACKNGLAALIPQMIAAYLVERRRLSAIPGMFWERRGTSPPRFCL